MFALVVISDAYIIRIDYNYSSSVDLCLQKKGNDVHCLLNLQICIVQYIIYLGMNHGHNTLIDNINITLIL